jgi:poly-gamma-glutamate synthesis protein (capsule biosynthesis protein)
MRPRRAFLLAALTVVLLLCALAQAASAPRGYVKGQGYEYISMGSYPQGKGGEVAPLVWCVLDVTDGRALLMTRYVIDAQQAIFESDEAAIKARTYRRIASFAESDLCAWMNDIMLPEILGDTGLGAALVAGEFGRLYPLSDEQFLTPGYGFSMARYGSGPTRLGKVTPYAAARGVYHDRLGNAPYWVAAIKDPAGYKMQIVGYNGHLSYGAYTRVNIGVRPALLLDLTLCDITGGTGTQDDPYQVALKAVAADTPAASAEPAATGSPPSGSPTAKSTQAATAAPAPASAAPASAAPMQNAAPAAEDTPAATVQPASSASTVATAAPALSGKPATMDMPAASAAPDGGTASASQADGDGLCTLSLIGDVSVGDAYQYRNSKNGLTAAIRDNGMAWAFARVRDVLAADALTAANLEVCLTDSDNASGKTFPLIAPPSYVAVLTEGGIDAVNTVNNHCFDFGAQGYADTLAALQGAGVAHFGTLVDGRGNASGQTLAIARGGVTFGFAGFSYPQNETLPVIGAQISALRDAGCDVVIVSLHWGRETFMTPKSGQPSYAAKIIDMGADAVWGHHPHVLQPVQFYKGKPVLFSTGNFIFGTMSKVEPATGIFQLHYEKTADGARLRSLTVVPCMTQRAPAYQPYVLTEQAARERVWELLRASRAYDGYENLPERFLTTGVAELNAQGNLIE